MERDAVLRDRAKHHRVNDPVSCCHERQILHWSCLNWCSSVWKIIFQVNKVSVCCNYLGSCRWNLGCVLGRVSHLEPIQWTFSVWSTSEGAIISEECQFVKVKPNLKSHQHVTRTNMEPTGSEKFRNKMNVTINLLILTTERWAGSGPIFGHLVGSETHI